MLSVAVAGGCPVPALRSSSVDNIMFSLMFSHDQAWSTGKWRILKMTQQGQHGFDVAGYTQTDPPESAPNQGGG